MLRIAQDCLPGALLLRHAYVDPATSAKQHAAEQQCNLFQIYNTSDSLLQGSGLDIVVSCLPRKGGEVGGRSCPCVAYRYIQMQMLAS